MSALHSSAVPTIERRPSQLASHVVALAGPNSIASNLALEKFLRQLQAIDRSHHLRSIAYMTALERNACNRVHYSDLAAPYFCINRTLCKNLRGYAFLECFQRSETHVWVCLASLNLEICIFLLYLMLTFTLLSFNIIMGG